MSRDAIRQVLVFSVLREVLGGQETLEVPSGALPAEPTVADLLAHLEERFPALREWRGRLLVAVNLEFATPATPLPPGAEIALMPPVQGG